MEIFLNYSPAAEERYYGVIDNALQPAAVRGVQVRMIVSNWNIREPDIYYLKSLQIISGVEIGISTIPEHSKSFIPFARVEHCKYMLVMEISNFTVLKSIYLQRVCPLKLNN